MVSRISSANKDMEEFLGAGRMLFMNIVNRTGPKWDPWGTPDDTGDEFDKASPNLVFWLLP